MIHPGLEALKTWKPIEYVAGYRARLAAIPIPQDAHHSWQCGWEDADTGHSNSPGMTVSSRRAGKTTTRIRGDFYSMQEVTLD